MAADAHARHAAVDPARHAAADATEPGFGEDTCFPSPVFFGTAILPCIITKTKKARCEPGLFYRQGNADFFLIDMFAGNRNTHLFSQAIFGILAPAIHCIIAGTGGIAGPCGFSNETGLCGFPDVRRP